MRLKKLWHKITFIGLREDQEFSHREIVLLNKLVFVATAIILPIIPLEVILNGWELVPYELIIVLMSGATLFFTHKGWFNLAKYYFFAMALFYVSFMGIAVGYGSGNELAMIAIFIAPSMLFKDIRVIILLSVITLAAFIGLKFVQDQTVPIFDIDMKLKENFRIIFQTMTLIIIFFQIYYFKNINLRFQEIVLRKNEVIAEKNKEIVDSINYAQRIQSAYLPPKDILTLFFPNSFLLFEPKDIVSGDFYWFYTPKNGEEYEDETFVIAADCTGHGVPGAIMSVICSNALNQVVVNEEIRDTGKILDLVRENVIRILKTTDDNDRKDGMDVALCRINRKSREVQFSGAHNPLWILKKDAHEIEVVKADKQPVGSFERQTPFQSHLVQLQEGDSIYIFSDGYQDQFGGEKGKKFKAANMKKLLLSSKESEMSHQHNELSMAFNNWKADLEQVDDVVVIGIKL